MITEHDFTRIGVRTSSTKTRIVEGSRTRVEPDEAELLLKSGELILCIVGLYHLLKGWKGHGSPINLSDVRLIRPA